MFYEIHCTSSGGIILWVRGVVLVGMLQDLHQLPRHIVRRRVPRPLGRRPKQYKSRHYIPDREYPDSYQIIQNNTKVIITIQGGEYPDPWVVVLNNAKVVITLSHGEYPDP